MARTADVQTVVAQHEGPLLRTAYLLTGDPASAEQLLAAALAVGHRGRPWGRPRPRPRPRPRRRWRHADPGGAPAADARRAMVWAMVWAMVQALVRREERPGAARPAGGPWSTGRTDPGPPPPGPVDDLRRALLSLPPRTRAALVLGVHDGFPETGTAAVLGGPPGTLARLLAEGAAGTGVDDVWLLRDRLQRLAEHAPAPRGAATAARVVADVRSRRRRAAAWAAGVLAIGGLLAAVPSTVSGLSPGSAAGAATEGEAGAGRATADVRESLYDLAPRGSLAGDEKFLAGVREVTWNAPDGGPGPAQGSRRVLYAADVPGGSRWALVMGRVGPQLVYAWFAGPVGAAPGELRLAGGPARAGVDQPIALLDAGGATGALVVVGRPGDRAEYSPSLDRDASGELGRTYTELPVVDGVPLGEVEPPRAYGAGQVRVLPDSGPPSTVEPMVVDDPRFSVPLGPGPDREPRQYWAGLRDCLAQSAFQVRLDPAGTGLSWSGGPALVPDVGWPSSAEQAENDAAFDRCLVQVAGG